VTGNCMSVPVVGAVLSSVLNHLAQSAAMPALPKQHLQPDQLALRSFRQAYLKKIRFEIGRQAFDVLLLSFLLLQKHAYDHSLYLNRDPF
jgi:hypothetical protein